MPSRVFSQDVKWLFMNDSITKTTSTGYSGIFAPMLSFDDNSFISGYSFTDSTTINGTNYYNSSTLSRCLILDFDSTQNIKSVINVGLGKSFYLNSMDKDDQNNIYMLCTFRDSLYIDSLPMIKAHGGFDFVIIKYNRKGKLQWVKQMGTGIDDNINDLKVRNQKLVFRSQIMGNFYVGDSLIKFDNVKSSEIYIFQLNSAGQIDWYRIIQPNIFYRSCEVLGIDILGNGNIVGTAYGRGDFNYLLFDKDTVFNPVPNAQASDTYIVMFEIDGNNSKFIKEKIIAKGLGLALVEIAQNDDIFVLTTGISTAFGSKIAPSNYSSQVAKFDKGFNLKWVNCSYNINSNNKTTFNRGTLDSYGNLIVTGNNKAKRTYLDKTGNVYEDQTGDSNKFHSMILVFDNITGDLKWHMFEKGPKDDWFSMALIDNKGDLLFTGGLEGGPANFKLGNSIVKTNHYYITYIAKISNNHLLNLPSQLNATAISNNQINLQWADSTTGEERFVIERSMDGNTWALHDSVTANTVSYQDTALLSNTTYYYKVSPVTSFFRGSPTNVAQATTLNTNIASYSNNIYNTLSIYPNPVKDVLYIAYNGNPCQAILSELSGKVVRYYNLNSYNNTLDVHELSAGVYIIYLPAFNHTVKFVKVE